MALAQTDSESGWWNQRGAAIDAGRAPAMSSDGNTVAIASGGAVRIMGFDGANWVQVGADIVDPTTGGSAVAMSNDGMTVVIGAPGHDGNGNNAGRVWVYSFDGAEWIQVGTAIDGDGYGRLSGSSVSISGDGMTIVLAAPTDYDCGDCRGHFRAFSFDGSDWAQIGTDLVPEPTPDHARVVMSDDGTSIVVVGNLSISVHRFDGVGWAQVGGDLVGNDSEALDSLAVSGDGMTIAIGEPEAGRVQVFSFDGTEWMPVGGHHAGPSVAMSDDASTVAVGSSSGEVRVLAFDGTRWNQLGANVDVPGSVWGLAVSSDGETFAALVRGQVLVYRYFRDLGVDTDRDGDGVLDIDDNCLVVANAGQADADGDMVGDACDLDADGDGFEGPLGDGSDCADDNPAVSPGAEEIDGNGEDENCSGLDTFQERDVVLLQNVATGRYLDSDSSRWNWNVDTSKVARLDGRWKLINNGDGTWALLNPRRARYLDASGKFFQLSSDRWNASLSPMLGEDDRWELIADDDGSYTLRNVFYDRYLGQTSLDDKNVNVVPEAKISDTTRWLITKRA